MASRFTNKYLINSFFYCLVFCLSCLPKDKSHNSENNHNNRTYYLSDLRNLESLNEEMGEPQPGDWLYTHIETGQTFKEYRDSEPVCPTKDINKIYIQPLGEFSTKDSTIIIDLAAYLGHFFGLKTILSEPLSDSIIPNQSRRIHEGTEQLHTKYVMDKLLLKTFPEDAIVLLAITSKDLYPEESWNFVFGQAYLKKRVGVCSLYRLRNEEDSILANRYLLNGIMKTASHEIAHMFSVKHCKKYKCLMNGSNSLMEADTKPSWLCPDCLAKIIWCTGNAINERYDQLITYSRAQGFREKEEFYQRSKELLQKCIEK